MIVVERVQLGRRVLVDVRQPLAVRDVAVEILCDGVALEDVVTQRQPAERVVVIEDLVVARLEGVRQLTERVVLEHLGAALDEEAVGVVDVRRLAVGDELVAAVDLQRQVLASVPSDRLDVAVLVDVVAPDGVAVLVEAHQVAVAVVHVVVGLLVAGAHLASPVRQPLQLVVVRHLHAELHVAVEAEPDGLDAAAAAAVALARDLHVRVANRLAVQSRIREDEVFDARHATDRRVERRVALWQNDAADDRAEAGHAQEVVVDVGELGVEQRRLATAVARLVTRHQRVVGRVRQRARELRADAVRQVDAPHQVRRRAVVLVAHVRPIEIERRQLTGSGVVVGEAAVRAGVDDLAEAAVAREVAHVGAGVAGRLVDEPVQTERHQAAEAVTRQ